MLRIIRNGFLRGTVAAVLVLCIVLSSGCVSVVISEKPTESSAIGQTEPTVPPVMADADLTFPDEIHGSYVPGSNGTDGTDSSGDAQTPEKDIEIDWNTKVVIEKDPNELSKEDLEKLVEENPQMADIMELIGPYIDIFGFAYDPEQDIFYSTQYPVQRIFGYNTLYDTFASRFGLYYITQRIRFDYDGKEWMIQLWKGQYGVTVGGEVGIYYRDANNFVRHFEAVADEDLVMMGFQLCKNGKPYLERGPEKHWWLTGFRILDVAVPTQLSMVIFFDWEKEDMADAFESGLHNMVLTDITFVRDSTRFWLTWTL
ncbi:MAG: DUF4474 domain-containing protein [Clostridia bacterium]|nr:DUF4474 domain-containing protein [Clostridia bacterium]